MPRNEAKPLSAADAAVQTYMHARLMEVPADKAIAITYIKRNGEESSSTGPIAFFNGKPGMDTGSVTIADTNKGNRTINMHRIVEVKIVEAI